MKILVLGSTGYIGRHFVSQCFLAGHETFRVDIEPQITRALEKSYKIDIRDTNKIIELVNDNKIEIIVNFAGKKSVSDSFLNKEEYFETNVHSVERIISSLPKSRVHKFINASSAAVYGIQKFRNVHEGLVPNPLSPYAESKLQSELVLRKWGSILGIQTYSLRFFNVAGSESTFFQDKSKDNLIPQIIRRNKNNETIIINGDNYDTNDGTAVRDYIHVIDVSMSILKLLEIPNANEYNLELNIGSGVGTSVLEVINEISKFLNKKIEFEIGPTRNGDIPAIVADISSAINLIDFKPKFNLNQIINSSM
jgi:UDP-glucose 4-epimerase